MFLSSSFSACQYEKNWWTIPLSFFFVKFHFVRQICFLSSFFCQVSFLSRFFFVRFLFCQVFFKLSLPTVSCYLSRTLNSLNNTFIQLFPTFQILGTLVLTSSFAALLLLWPQDPNMLGIFLSYISRPLNLKKYENILKIWTFSKFWKFSDNLKIFQKAENFPKIWKFPKNMSDQMSQRSQVSRITL